MEYFPLKIKNNILILMLSIIYQNQPKILFLIAPNLFKNKMITLCNNAFGYKIKIKMPSIILYITYMVFKH